jgi:hypothetical protein
VSDLTVRRHSEAVCAVGALVPAADTIAGAVDAMAVMGGADAADVALQLHAARVALLAAHAKAHGLLIRRARQGGQDNL